MTTTVRRDDDDADDRRPLGAEQSLDETSLAAVENEPGGSTLRAPGHGSGRPAEGNRTTSTMGLDFTTAFNTSVRRLAYSSIASAGWALGQGRRRIVMFHGVTRGKAAQFERQLRYLTQAFRVCRLRELLNDDGPSNAVALTFDDGLRNHLTVVQPLLQKYRVPATFYVCPGLIDSGCWLWNHEARQRLLRMPGPVRQATATTLGAADSDVEEILSHLLDLPARARAGALDVIREASPGFTPTGEEAEAFDLMTWGELKRLDPRLVTIGCHSKTRPILPTLDSHELAAEIVEGRLMLEEELGQPVVDFSYPYGSHDLRVLSLVRQNYESAVTAEPGLLAADSDPYLLPRIAAAENVALLAWRMYRPGPGLPPGKACR
jgi:peptidoglycan/xylan/chitin deacetylase (PgdA/CDA1 family)